MPLSELLGQLEALEAPSGQPPARFEELRSAMRELLLDSGRARWTSAAPQDAANKVGDLYLTRIDDTTATALWTYRNLGDYDQNSQVNISDLSPLGALLGKTSASLDWNLARAADGDGNGEISVSDLTPLGSHLLNTVDAYSVQSTATPAVEASWAEIAVVLTADATSASAGPRTFSAAVPAAAGQSFRVVPLHGEEQGVPSDPYAYDGTGGAPAMDPAAREAIFDAIEEKLGALEGTTSDEQDAEIATLMEELPGIEPGADHGPGWDGAISGVFEDGRALLVLKNRAPDYSLAESQSESHYKATAKEASGMPIESDALALNAFTEGEPHYSPAATLAAMLDSHGYYCPDAYGLSLEIVSGIKDLFHQIGILYIDGHGGVVYGKYGEPRLYAISLATVVTPELEAAHSADLSDKSLIYTLVPASAGWERRFAFTDRFVGRHGWSFKEDTLVFLNTCQGGHPAAAPMRKALAVAGANTIMGWTASVPDSRAVVGALEFFDIALGDNSAIDVDPPQRPFQYWEALTDMTARGTAAAGQPLAYPATVAHLDRWVGSLYTGTDHGDGADGMLLPTIRGMTLLDVDDNPAMQLLSIGGSFGARPGTVYIDNQAFTWDDPALVDWTEYSITMALPTFEFGIPFGGDVYVTYDNDSRKSNRCALTEWHGELQITQVEKWDTMDGEIIANVYLNLHHRQVVQKQRLESSGETGWYGNVPVEGAHDVGNGNPTTFLQDSWGEISYEGALTETFMGGEGEVTRTIFREVDGEAQLEMQRNDEQDRYINGRAYLDPIGEKFYIYVYAHFPYIQTHTDTRYEDTSNSNTTNISLNPFADAQGNLGGWIVIPAGSAESFAIPGGTIETSHDVDGLHFTYTLTWNGWTVSHAPDPSGSR